MTTRNRTIDLRRKVVYEYSKVNLLEEKLRTYNEDIGNKEDLQIRVNDLKRVLDEVAHDMKQTNENHIIKKESISRMLEHCKTTENSLSVNIQRLRDTIDHIKKRIDALKLGKENVVTKIEKLNKRNESLENELVNVKASVEERDEANRQLSRRLACLEDECRGARKQTEECRTTFGRLRDKCGELEVGLERELAAVADARARLTDVTGRLELDRGTLAGRLEAGNRVLRDAEAECAAVRRRAADEGRDAVALAARATELRDMDAALRRDADARKRWLCEEVAAREAHVRRLDAQLAALRRDDAMAAEVTAAARIVRDKADQLAGAQRRAEDERRALADACERSARRAAELRCDVRDRKAAVDGLEREACRLRDELDDRPCGRLECGDDASGGCGGGHGGDCECRRDGSDDHECGAAAGRRSDGDDWRRPVDDRPDRLHVDLELTRREDDDGRSDDRDGFGAAADSRSDGDDWRPVDDGLDGLHVDLEPTRRDDDDDDEDDENDDEDDKNDDEDAAAETSMDGGTDAT